MDTAIEAGGKNHGFRFVQVPLSVGLPEAAIDEYENRRHTVLEQSAKYLSLTVFASRTVDGADGEQGAPKNAFSMCV